jgi:hypothetical protein
VPRDMGGLHPELIRITLFQTLACSSEKMPDGLSGIWRVAASRKGISWGPNHPLGLASGQARFFSRATISGTSPSAATLPSLFAVGKT